MLSEVIPEESMNDQAEIEVTPLGITTAPVQEVVLVTTSLATAKLPVPHWKVPEIPPDAESMTDGGASQGQPEGIVPKKTMFVRLLFSWNAPTPMEVSDAGIVTEVNADDWNA
jgi:hypothetical protein